MQTRRTALAALAGAPALWAQARHPASGRIIAPVMGAAGAPWLERGERESEENPAKAIELLGLRPGMTVADLGAGTGYYSVRMARLVGPEGKVFAVDIQPRMIELLTARLRSASITNVVPVLGKEADPRLPAGQLDLILMVDVYHELAQPQAMLGKLHRALRPSGRLVLLEYRKEDASIPIRLEHKMSVAEVKAELEPEGFEIAEIREELPWQHLFSCRKK